MRPGIETNATRGQVRLIWRLLFKIINSAYVTLVKYPRVLSIVANGVNAVPGLFGHLSKLTNTISQLGRDPEDRNAKSSELSHAGLREALVIESLNNESKLFTHKSLAPEVGSPLRKKNLALVTPWPPQRSGIADYSRRLANELAHHFDITIVTESRAQYDFSEQRDFKFLSSQEFPNEVAQFDQIIYQLGNSELHKFQVPLMENFPGILDLHDFYLDGLAGHIYLDRHETGAIAKSEIYSSGYGRYARRLTAERAGIHAEKSPMNLLYLQQATAVVYHSKDAMKLLRNTFPIQEESKFTYIPLFPENPRPFFTEARRSIDSAVRGHVKIAVLGFVTANKHSIEILEAVELLASAGSRKFTLTFVGEFLDKELASSFASRLPTESKNLTVSVTGWVEREVYENQIETADLCVQLRSGNSGEGSASILDVISRDKILVSNFNFDDLPESYSKLVKINSAISKTSVSAAIERALLINRDSQPTADSGGILLDERREQAAAKYSELILETPKFCDYADTFLLSPNPRRRQLYIDVSAVNQNDLGTGIQRVVKAFVREWLDSEQSNIQISPVFYSPEHKRYFHASNFSMALLGYPNIGLEELPAEVSQGDVFLCLDLISTANYKKALDAIREKGASVFFVVYDILPILLPHCFPKTASISFANWIEMVTKFQGVFCISDAVTEEFKSYVVEKGITPKDNFVIQRVTLGSDIETVPNFSNSSDQQVVRRHESEDDVFLMVGTIEPRKGHLEVLDCFTEMWNKGSADKLIIVGKKGWMVDDLIKKINHHPQFGKKLIWLDYVSDLQLLQVYKDADCLIAASLGEGFGLPIVEAYRNKLPVIARKIAVFQEVAGNGATYFGGLDGPSLAHAIATWKRSRDQNQTPELVAVTPPSWTESAAIFLNTIIESTQVLEREFSND